MTRTLSVRRGARKHVASHETLGDDRKRQDAREKSGGRSSREGRRSGHDEEPGIFLNSAGESVGSETIFERSAVLSSGPRVESSGIEGAPQGFERTWGTRRESLARRRFDMALRFCLGTQQQSPSQLLPQRQLCGGLALCSSIRPSPAIAKPAGASRQAKATVVLKRRRKIQSFRQLSRDSGTTNGSIRFDSIRLGDRGKNTGSVRSVASLVLGHCIGTVNPRQEARFGIAPLNESLSLSQPPFRREEQDEE